jgi:hypothetical protein
LIEQAPAGWILKSVIVNGVDVTDQPLDFGTTKESLDDVEVIVTNHTSEISGVVVDDAGRSITTYSLLVFPVERALRYAESRFVRRVSPDAQGRFRVSTLPSTNYFIAAIEAPSEMPPAAITMMVGGIRKRSKYRQPERHEFP